MGASRMGMRPTRTTALVAWSIVLGLSGAASRSAGEPIPPYDNLVERQNQAITAHLPNMLLDTSLDLSSAGETTLNQQARDLIVELEAQRRGLSPTLGVTPAAADGHLQAIIVRLGEVVADPPPSWNRMLAYQAGLYTAYLLNRYPTVWSETTREAARALYRDSISHGDFNDPGNWDAPADLLGDSRAACTGMRLLGGDALDDDVLVEFARSEIFRTRARIARGAHGHMQPHYTGVNLSVLALMTQDDDIQGVHGDDVDGDDEIRDAVRDILEWVLLLPAHLYLPGGGLGAPKDRTKGEGGGIEDPSPTKPEHLGARIDDLVYDPALAGGSDVLLATVEYYAVPEIIRSIFLDKGAGYTFRHAPVNHQDPEPSAPETHTYPFGWQGWDGAPMASPMGVIPWEVVVLPGGDALLGIKYGGERTGHSISNGVYLRRPGGSPAFSILYQYQKELEGSEAAGEDKDDPKWNRERETPWRRMLHERTAISLWDVDYPQAEQYEYTLAAVPDFTNLAVADRAETALSASSGLTWRIGQSGSAYVAYLPLGPYTETDMSPDWKRLRFDAPISGYIVELATDAEYIDIEAYKQDLVSRYVSFSGTTAADAVVEIDVVDHTANPKTTERIRLEYDPERRYVGGVQQDDEDFLLSDGYLESPWVSWDDSSFTLNVSRGPDYAPVVLDFGDPTRPTAPHQVEAGSGPSAVYLSWEHGWDDVGISEYVIYRSDDPETEVARVPGTQASFFSQLTPHPAGVTKAVVYSIAADDGTGSNGLSESRGVSGLVMVPGDDEPPSVPDGLSGAVNWITWDPSTDNSGTVAGYEVYRDDVWVATVAEPEFWDQAQLPGTSYVYEIAAFDPDGNVSERSAPHGVTTGTDVSPPTAPVVYYGAVHDGTVLVGWHASSDDVGVLEYLVMRDGAPHGTSVYLGLFDSEVEEGTTYTYEVIALDAAGNASQRSDPGILVTVPDVTPPSTPSITQAVVVSGRVFVSWTAATDNVGVADYEVLRDGVALEPTVTGLDFLEWAPPPGSYAYTVRARDAAGNVSPQSAPEIVVIE